MSPCLLVLFSLTSQNRDAHRVTSSKILLETKHAHCSVLMPEEDEDSQGPNIPTMWLSGNQLSLPTSDLP